MRYLILIPLLAACAILSASATPQEKIDEADAILVWAQEVGPALVRAGKIKNEEYHVAVALLDTAVGAYKASLVADDAAKRAALRLELTKAIAKVTTLLITGSPPPEPVPE